MCGCVRCEDVCEVCEGVWVCEGEGLSQLRQFIYSTGGNLPKNSFVLDQRFCVEYPTPEGKVTTSKESNNHIKEIGYMLLATSKV